VTNIHAIYFVPYPVCPLETQDRGADREGADMDFVTDIAEIEAEYVSLLDGICNAVVILIARFRLR